MTNNTSLCVFEHVNIRKTWHNDEWWFVVEDIVRALTDSKDPKQYIQKMKLRDETLSQGWVQIIHTLPIKTSGGLQQMNCTNTEGAFRIIQSIPSKNAEPFKLWLAKTGYERIQEIENPELGQDRIKEYYELKGYPKEWIDKRLRGIAVRQELTDVWKNREIKTKNEFAILTNEISKATFGKTVGEYKEFKQLKSQNLRDHMSDVELIFTMLGEASTTEITKETDSQGFTECKDSAHKGGSIAGRARKDLEKNLGRSIVSEEQFLLEENEPKLKKEYIKRIQKHGTFVPLNLDEI